MESHNGKSAKTLQPWKARWPSKPPPQHTQDKSLAYIDLTSLITYQKRERKGSMVRGMPHSMGKKDDKKTSPTTLVIIVSRNKTPPCGTNIPNNVGGSRGPPNCNPREGENPPKKPDAGRPKKPHLKKSATLPHDTPTLCLVLCVWCCPHPTAHNPPPTSLHHPLCCF